MRNAWAKSVGVGRRDENTGNAVLDDLRQGAGAGRDYRHAAGHRLDSGKSEAFVKRGRDEYLAAIVEPHELVG